jgi:putative lipoprotein
VRRAGRALAALGLIAAMPAVAETVTGTATYRERMMLPPGAVLEAVVEDISRADAPAPTLARTAFAPEGGPPWAFRMEVDPSSIDPRATLSVRATIRHDGALLFTTDTVAPVLTRGAPAHVDLRLVRVAGAASPPALTGIDWRIAALGGAPLPPAAGEPTIRFEAGMDAAGFGASVGCNRFGGSVRIEGAALAFGPVRTTRMACPPTLDAAEAALSAALDGAARWTVAGGTLRLLDADGRVLLEAEAP